MRRLTARISTPRWRPPACHVSQSPARPATSEAASRPRLLEAGYDLRCLVRSPRKLEERDWTDGPARRSLQSDLSDQTALTRDLSGCDAAFYLVHSMMSSDPGVREAGPCAGCHIRRRRPRRRRSVESSISAVWARWVPG